MGRVALINAVRLHGRPNRSSSVPLRGVPSPSFAREQQRTINGCQAPDQLEPPKSPKTIKN
eukprot:5720400-Amphidinium_carterae.1